MKTTVLSILFGILAGTALVQGEATGTQVAVFFDGNTPVNSDAIHFLEHQVEADHWGYKLVPTQNPAEILPGKFKAVLVLNTGLEAGIDRRLAQFILGWPNKKEVILVSLKKGAQDTKVETFAPNPATLGVDAVAAASKWEGRGLSGLFGGGSPVYQMHVTWSNQVFSYIGQLP